MGNSGWPRRLRNYSYFVMLQVATGCYRLLGIAIDVPDRAVIFRAVKKITFSNDESRVETSLLSLSLSFKYMQNLIGIINQLRKLLGSTASLPHCLTASLPHCLPSRWSPSCIHCCLDQKPIIDKNFLIKLYLHKQSRSFSVIFVLIRAQFSAATIDHVNVSLQS